MTDTSRLKEYIEKSGYRMSYIAKTIGITHQGLLLKINNKHEFKASEIDKLCKLLKINIRERMAIFFAK